jgi:acyl transferase domain-containing protein
MRQGVALPRVSEPPRANSCSSATIRPGTCAHASSTDGGRERPAPTLAELAVESQRDFDPGKPCRLAVVATDAGDLREKLDRAVAMVGRQPDAPFALPGGVFYDRGPADPGRVAFVFPGQGSQYIGMGGDIAMAFPAAQHVWDFAAGLDVGERALGDIVFPVPVFTDEQRAAQELRLTDTRWAQPALAAHSLSMLALLTSMGVEPDCAAGHSLGELVALHAAGAMDAESLLRLARRRGELLAQIDAEPGTMLAVGADADAVASAIKESAIADLWLANINAPRQTVVSGTVHAIEALHGRLSAAGITARRLAVSAAFHSSLARSAVGPLREFLEQLELTAPRIDVYGNADAAIYRSEPDAIRRTLAEHPAAPVRFLDQIEAMYADGVRTFIEVGAGSALTGLIGAILGDRGHVAVSLDKRGRDGVTAWHEAVGRLAVYGVPMDPAKLSQDWHPASSKPAPPAAPPRMSVRINGTGYTPPSAPMPMPMQASPAPPAPAPARRDSSGARRPHDRVRPHCPVAGRSAGDAAPDGRGAHALPARTGRLPPGLPADGREHVRRVHRAAAAAAAAAAGPGASYPGARGKRRPATGT